MDKPKHKDGMLAAGKKRLQQFRQKKQNKGGSSKDTKSDEESGSSIGTKHKSSNEGTLSSNLEGSDMGGEGLPIDLRVVRDDGIDSPSAAEQGYSSGSREDPIPGSCVSNMLESSSTSEQPEKISHDKGENRSGEICLRIDELEQSSSDVPGHPSSASGFDHNDISMVSDLRIAVGEILVPKLDDSHDPLDDVDGKTKLREESSMTNPQIIEVVEAVQGYESTISSFNATEATVEMERSSESAEVTSEDHSSGVSHSESASLHQVWDCLHAESTSHDSKKNLEDADNSDNGAAMAENSPSEFQTIREVTDEKILPNSSTIHLTESDDLVANQAHEDVPGTKLQMDGPSVSMVVLVDPVEDGISSLSSSSVIKHFQSDDKLDGVSTYNGASGISSNSSSSQAAVDIKKEFEAEAEEAELIRNNEIISFNATEGQVYQVETPPVPEVDVQSLSGAEVVEVGELKSEAHTMSLGPLEEEKAGHNLEAGQVTESRNEEHAWPPVASVDQGGSDVVVHDFDEAGRDVVVHAFEEGHKLHNVVNLISEPDVEDQANGCEFHGEAEALGLPDGQVAISSSYVKHLSEEVGEFEQLAEERKNPLEVTVLEDKVLTNIQEEQAEGECEDVEDKKERCSATFLDGGLDDAATVAVNDDDNDILLPMTQSNMGHFMELDSTGHEAHTQISDRGAVEAAVDTSRDFEPRSRVESSSMGILVLDVDAGTASGSGPESPPGQVLVIDSLVMNDASDSNPGVTMAGDLLSTWEGPMIPPSTKNSLGEEIVAEVEVGKKVIKTKMEPTLGKDEEHPDHVEAYRANEVAAVPDGGGGLLEPSSGVVPEGSNHPKEELESALTSSYALNRETGLDIVLEQGNDEPISGKASSSFHTKIPVSTPDLSRCENSDLGDVESHVHGDVDSYMPVEPTSNPVFEHVGISEIMDEKPPPAGIDLQPCLVVTPQIDVVISGVDPNYEVVSLDASHGNDEYLPPLDSRHDILPKDSKSFSMNPLPPGLDPDASQTGGTDDLNLVSQEGGHALCKEVHKGHDPTGYELLQDMKREPGVDTEGKQLYEALEEKTRLESVIKELEESLHTQELALEKLTNDHNCQAAKTVAQRDACMQILAHLATRLGHLVSQGSELDNGETALLSNLSLVGSGQVPESVNLDLYRHLCDSWIDELSKGLKDKWLAITGQKQLEGLLSSKDGQIEALAEKIKELGNELETSVVKSKQLECGTSHLQELLCLRETDLERLSNEVLELSRSNNLAMSEVSESREARVQLEGELKDFQKLHAEQEAGFSKTVLELSEAHDMAMAEVTKLVEDRSYLEGEVSHLQKLHEEQEAALSKRVLELSEAHDMAVAKVAKLAEDRSLLEGEVSHLQKLHAEQEASLSNRVLELSEAQDMAMAEVAKLVGDRSHLEGEVSHLQKVNEEQNCLFSGRMMELSTNYDLALEELGKVVEGRASIENEVNHLQEMHSRMCALAADLSGKVSALVGDFSADMEAVAGDVVGILDLSVTSLLRHCETVCREKEGLYSKVSDSETAYESLGKELAFVREQLSLLTGELIKAKEDGRELNSLQALVSAKDVELGHLNEQVSLLKMELTKTREEGEIKIQEAEHKLLGVRERLSMAVTKGKGLVQQRDNLKQLLAEKTAELEAMASSYKSELHAKRLALEEAESRMKLNAEAVERVEALESELSYIRNSANTLRESFLQKDAVLQKIEELLEYSGLPEELQIKDTFERIEWLLESYAHKNSFPEGQREDHYASSIKVPREMGDSSEQALQHMQEVEQLNRKHDDLLSEQALLHMQEIEQLNRKCDDLLRKYRGMAEQSAMLEQSLLERNLVIQRWEELLDSFDMPASIRSKEPEDKIEWLGMAVSDAHTTIAHFQAEMESMHAEAEALHRAKDEEAESLRTEVEALNQAVERLQEQNLAFSGQILAKDEEFKRVALDMEEMTLKFNAMSTQSLEESPQAELRCLEREQEVPPEMEAIVTKVRTLLSQVLEGNEADKVFSADIPLWSVLERSVEVLVDSCKVRTLEATEATRNLDELVASASKLEREKEKELEDLHEALSLKSAEMGKLSKEAEELVAEQSSLEGVVDGLREQVKAVSKELAAVREELGKSRLELGQGEEKLASVREKLSMAVKKGKSVVQQRDAMRQSLEEKTAQLDHVLKERESESLAMAKVKQSLQHHLQQVEALEAELAANRDYTSGLEESLQESNRILQKLAEALDRVSIASGAPRSGDVVERMKLVSQYVNDLQRKAGTSEQEAKKSRRATELLALELEEVHTRMESLADELAHAEKSISALMEEKKVAEASKVDAGLRLEHAMANVNSLLYELNESRDSLANLQHENTSLKESLSAQMDEIRNKQTKADSELKEMTHLHDQVHVLRDHIATFLSLVANQVSKWREGMEGTKSLVLSILEEFKDCGAFLSPAARVQLDISSNWGLEFPTKVKLTQDWKQGVTCTLRLLCEEMEGDLQKSSGYLEKSMAASEQDTAALSRLLLEMRDGMLSLKKEADVWSSSSSLIMEKDGQIRALEEVCKLVVERVRSTIDELEGSSREAGRHAPRNGTSPHDVEVGVLSTASAVDLHAVMGTLLERLSASAKDSMDRCQQLRIQGDRESELLRKHVGDATTVIELMGQQQQVDKLKISELLKQVEEFEGKEDMLKETNEQIYLLQDALASKRQEEERLLEALAKAKARKEDQSAKVEELEKAKQELEASLAKASHRFQTTINRFNKFQSLSEKLIDEAQSLHLLLEDRDAEIALLKEEVAAKGSQVSSLENALSAKNVRTSQLLRHIRSMVGRDTNGGTEPLVGELELLEGEASSTKELLEAIAASIRAGADSLHMQLARKDALLQDVQMRNDDLARKVVSLESSLLENQRLLEGRGPLVAERSMITVESEEVANRGKHPIPSVAIVTHGRSGRKSSASDHLALDMELAESSRPLMDLDNDEDKGHVFRPLTSLQLVPRGTRFLVDRLDGFWVSGERLLRRRPGARMSVMLYWLVLHIWMVALLL